MYHQQPPSGRIAGPNDGKSSLRETAAGDPPGLKEQVSLLDLFPHYHFDEMEVLTSFSCGWVQSVAMTRHFV